MPSARGECCDNALVCVVVRHRRRAHPLTAASVTSAVDRDAQYISMYLATGKAIGDFSTWDACNEIPDARLCAGAVTLSPLIPTVYTGVRSKRMVALK